MSPQKGGLTKFLSQKTLPVLTLPRQRGVTGAKDNIILSLLPTWTLTLLPK